MFTIATFDEVVLVGDSLISDGAGAGGVIFLVSFVVVGPFVLKSVFGLRAFAPLSSNGNMADWICLAADCKLDAAFGGM